MNEDIRPRTATEGRRRKPSTRPAKPTAKTASSKPKRNVKARIHEDKREAPEEMITKAKPKNQVGNGKQDKSSHALESSSPGKRPSRKSTRGGANHIKPDSQQRRQVTRSVRSAKSRHAQAS